MKIRSITYFCDPHYPLDEKVLRHAGEFLADARTTFEQGGYEVQTTRLATPPFPTLVRKLEDTPRLAEALSAILPQVGIAYASLGPALPEHPGSYAVIPDAIAASRNIFFSGVMADTRRGISLEAVRACARIIVRTALLEPNGFANLNFAALANVPPGAPFFPAAYHDGHDTAFSIATESADLAVEAFSHARTIEEARTRMVAALESNAQALVAAAGLLKYKYQVRFSGIDFSLAPFPDASRSIGAAMERMGVPVVGSHGSLAAAAILTEAIERAHFPRAGFNGLLLSVLEDSVLANRAAEGRLTVKDLLAYSAVCGTGLDTVPLPGDVSSEAISTVLLDLAALALRLDKPLTARLMPVPGKQAGDPTAFDFGFFANSRVMALDGMLFGKLLKSSETFPLLSRPARKEHD